MPLTNNKFRIKPSFVIIKKNVDFLIINKKNRIVLTDVKIVESVKRQKDSSELDAHFFIRKDIRVLREKVKGAKIECPVVLVSMNFSTKYFTALTIAKALLGDIVVEMSKTDLTSSEPHHSLKGKAAFTAKHNTHISGVLIFDYINKNHIFLHNPYAKNRMKQNYFPGVKEIDIDRQQGIQEMISLSEFKYFSVNMQFKSMEKRINKGALPFSRGNKK